MGSDKKHPFLSMSKSRSRSRSRSKSGSRSTNKRSSHHKHKSSRKRDDYRRRSRSSSYRGRDRRRQNHSKSRSRSRSRSNKRSRNDRKRKSRERIQETHSTRNIYEETTSKENQEPEIEPEKPCFIPSGILARYTNTVNGVTLKFTEPPDAAIPTTMWRIYPFKGEEALPALHIHRQSCYLIGKDSQVADIIVENPTCSSQHAVIQFREVKKQIGEEVISEIRPYIMDLDSKNGTFLNDEKLEPARYYQLLNKDVIKLANSTREYVIMNG